MQKQQSGFFEKTQNAAAIREEGGVLKLFA